MPQSKSHNDTKAWDTLQNIQRAFFLAVCILFSLSDKPVTETPPSDVRSALFDLQYSDLYCPACLFFAKYVILLYIHWSCEFAKYIRIVFEEQMNPPACYCTEFYTFELKLNAQLHEFKTSSSCTYKGN